MREWEEAFFAVLERTADPELAAHRAGRKKSVVYYHRNTKPEFAARWEQALLAHKERRRRLALLCLSID